MVRVKIVVLHCPSEEQLKFFALSRTLRVVTGSSAASLVTPYKIGSINFQEKGNVNLISLRDTGSDRMSV